MITRATPFSSQPRTVFMSRMPPPSCTGMFDGQQNLLDGLGVHRLAGESAVEIDDMQMIEPLPLERPRLRRRDRR